MKTEPNHGAFASQSQTDIQEGLTKREYFASMAMQGLLSNPDWMREREGQKYLMDDETVSRIAVKFTDALIAELNK